MSTPLLRRLAAYHSHNSINCNREEPTQDQNQYPHHQQQQQHQLPVLQSTSKSLPYIPPVVSPLRPNRHNSVSQKRPLPPVPPNQIGSNGLLRLATYLSGFYQSAHPTSFTGSNQSDKSTSSEPQKPTVQEATTITPQSSFVTLELEHDQSGVMYHPENQSQCLLARKSQTLQSEPQIPIIITEKENLDNVPKLVIQDKCDDDESSSQEREKATEESLSRLEYLKAGIPSTKEVQKEAIKDYYHCSFLKRIKSQEFISYFGEKLKFMEKKEWNVWFEKYLRQLDEKKPIVWGDKRLSTKNIFKNKTEIFIYIILGDIN
ncbi:hypothetical protein PPACK8108_LOCUS17953 [Phakopsora pachyrhizi]|uniref:Uncharacterized protein n=1 Tax=Phakopsora pachyrhizi TaxID=170000 RepID=A0AAV0BBL7_PHAPC|nr:hypothetical protein PPACK8108_LOCUS17953 [Phakopsora pachyrhizi]